MMTEEEIKVLQGLDWLSKNSVYGAIGVPKKENNIDPDFERKWEQFKIDHDEFDKRFHTQKAEIEAERRRIKERCKQFKEEYDLHKKQINELKEQINRAYYCIDSVPESTTDYGYKDNNSSYESMDILEEVSDGSYTVTTKIVEI